ncbi:MAG TPA: hypothetical protein PLG89_11175 [Arenimonas sp.]|nr:hypothetical protein [Arenimonas sp.]
MTSPSAPSSFAWLLLAALLLAATPAAAQRSARDTFDAELTRQGQGAAAGQWSQWQYESAPLSGPAGLDFDFAWGYVDAAVAAEGDAFVAVVRNHSRHAYCIRPRVGFKGDVSRVTKLEDSVVLGPGESIAVANLRIARRTKLEHDINAAFWPAPSGTAPGRCRTGEPAGLADWLRRTGEAPFPGNRVKTETATR